MNLVHDISYGDLKNTINTIIEIPKNSMHKIEYDLERSLFVLDRIEPGIFAKPVNYGFIPQTLDEDSDPLDTLVISDEPISTGILVKAHVIAILNFVDDGENDHKIICVPADDRHDGSLITDLDDLSGVWKNQLVHHFNHYKDLKKPGTTVVEGFGDSQEAWKIIQGCHDRYNKHFEK